jgi:predicted nucleotidyltransferase
MDKYSEILSSFGTQETLNPQIWDDVESDEPKLKPQIRKALLMIAGEFMDFLGDDLFVDDVRFTGSLANYNWSKFSDIDLHLYVDFSQFDVEDVEVYKELFQLKKTLFNTTHNITVKGFDVELYAEDIDESHFSSGVYSVMFDTWVHNPEKENVKIQEIKVVTKQQVGNGVSQN